jgi:hypothetical protein
MLNSLSQFQAQGWEKGYPESDLLGGANYLKDSKRYIVYPA